MHKIRRALWFVFLASVLAGLAVPASAGWGSLTDKLKEKAQQKAGEKIDAALNKSPQDSAKSEPVPANAQQPPPAPVPATPPAGSAAAPAAGSTSAAAPAENMTLYTKYDFVPGDRVIFYDDLSQEEMGEFPSRWKLDSGVFEVAKESGQNWIFCSNQGSIRPKVAAGPLPPKYTVEMDFMTKEGGTTARTFTIGWVDASDQEIASITVVSSGETRMYLHGKDMADKTLSDPLGSGKHTLRIMATRASIKCYVDHERIANLPAADDFAPAGLVVELSPYENEADNPMLVGNFRYAEGGKTLKEQLDESGRIVTHGILFDSGSDRIRAESYKTLADIGGLLTDNATLRLSIEGHTDSDGADDLNMKLSASRAEAVRKYLIDTYKIDASRLESKGWGKTKPIDANSTPEGKANNRRVELVKL